VTPGGGFPGRLRVLLVACLSPACGRYGDFTLPRLSGSGAPITPVFEMRAQPVIGRGAFRDVLNPSVIRTHGRYLNLYSAFDARTWHTVMAESADGQVWRDRGIVLSPDSQSWEGSYIAANGSMAAQGDVLLYWYQAGPKGHPQIGLAEGAANGTWRKEPRPVLERGPYGSWDQEGVADPYVIRIDGMFYMYYLGQDRGRPTRQRIGVARSRDGRRWQKLRANPVLESGEPGTFDEAAAGEPAVWLWRGRYWMLYTGSDFAGKRRLGLAVSGDGVLWTKLQAFSGQQDWDGKVICDPTVLVDGDVVRVWFGGGDVASPDENLHGQIGYGTLTMR